VIAKGCARVKFHEKICASLRKAYSPTVFLASMAVREITWLVCKVEHSLSGTPKYRLANDEVENRRIDACGFTVTTLRPMPGLCDQHLDAGICKVCQAGEIARPSVEALRAFGCAAIRPVVANLCGINA